MPLTLNVTNASSGAFCTYLKKVCSDFLYLRYLYLINSQIWNNLPKHGTSAELLSTLCRQLEMHLFTQSFPDSFLDVN